MYVGIPAKFFHLLFGLLLEYVSHNYSYHSTVYCLPMILHLYSSYCCFKPNQPDWICNIISRLNINDHHIIITFYS